MSNNVLNSYQTFYDSNGDVRATGIVTFYDNLTTDLASIYSDEALTVAQSNPYTLDASGRIVGDVKYTGVLTLKITNADLSDTRTDDNVATTEGATSSISVKSANYTTVIGDHNSTIEVDTPSITITLLAIASATTGYTVTVKNSSGGSITFDATGAETIDGSATAITMTDDEVITVQLNQAETGYIILQPVGLVKLASANTFTDVNTFTKSVYTTKGADIASANDLVLLTDGNYNDITGTTQVNGFTDGVANEVRKFHHDGAAPFKHTTAPSSGFSQLFITAAAADWTSAANDETEWTYDGTFWRMTGYVLASGKAITASTAAQGASLVLLDTQTASTSAALNFISSIDSTYSAYKFEIDELIVDTDGAELEMVFSTDLGVSYEEGAADYDWVWDGSSTTGVVNGVNAASAFMELANALGNGTGESLSGEVVISHPSSTTSFKTYRGLLTFVGVGALTTGVQCHGAYLTAATDIDAVRFRPNSGTFVSGVIRMYGLKNS